VRKRTIIEDNYKKMRVVGLGQVTPERSPSRELVRRRVLIIGLSGFHSPKKESCDIPTRPK